MQQYLLAPVRMTDQGVDWTCAHHINPIGLTATQYRMVDFIRRYQQLWGDTPMYREIAEGCGLRTVSGVGYQIARLVKLGVVHKPARRVRAILIKNIPVKLS